MNNERGIDVRIAICEDNRQDAEALEDCSPSSATAFLRGFKSSVFPPERR